MNKEYIPKKTRILDIINEASDIKTFKLQGKLNSKPGQFVMLHIPGHDQRPFSIYIDDNDSFSLTIAKVGRFTKKLFEMKISDNLVYTGPFGKPFQIKGKHIAMIGGGYGSAPLTFLGKEALKQGVKSELIIGARSKEFLLYKNNNYPVGIIRHYCTDDGSFGFKGYTTEKLKELFEQDKTIDMVYTVGPELMMKIVVEICDEFNIGCQISLERYMKCGNGICGSCCVDPDGLRMCVEGPCIDKKVAKKVSEFGNYHRDGSGKKIYFKK
ncbi:MAG: dihydroorotate dehydrogenase electron transfer subunit [Nanoarchaeota archaeon]